MKKIVLPVLVMMTFLVLCASTGFSEMVLEEKRVKMVNFHVAPDGLGIEFEVVRLRAPGSNLNITPNSSCVNHFLLPSSAEDFDMKAAVLMSAKLTNGRIMIEFDDAQTDCWVVVSGVGLAE